MFSKFMHGLLFFFMFFSIAAYLYPLFLSPEAIFLQTGVPVRAINRPGSQLLGANGRDDGPVVSLPPFCILFYLEFIIFLSK